MTETTTPVQADVVRLDLMACRLDAAIIAQELGLTEQERRMKEAAGDADYYIRAKATAYLYRTTLRELLFVRDGSVRKGAKGG